MRLASDFVETHKNTQMETNRQSELARKHTGACFVIFRPTYGVARRACSNLSNLGQLDRRLVSA